MRYQTIVEGIRDIAESHKSIETFATGLESDIDPSASTLYPLIFLAPPTPTAPLTQDSIGSNESWTVHLEAQEIISDASTTQQKEEALDRTLEYLRDVYYKFILNGFDVTSVTVNNKTENLDFRVTTESPFQPFIQINDGVTGWMVDFTIQEGNNSTLCHLDDVFN